MIDAILPSHEALRARARRAGGRRGAARARYTVFQMAEVAVPRDLFPRILMMIDDLRPAQSARC